ncbi:MAG: PilW family protein [Pseudomonadales bacterium]|nr:PilW family protein [Pseudomonadales bacterium]
MSNTGNTRQQGFSLVELMIAMLLGTFLIGGLMSVFISSAHNYKVQQALTEVQHKGRYILRILRQDVQKAGFNFTTSEAVKEFTGGVGDCAPGREIFEIYWNAALPPLEEIWRYCYYVTADNVLMRNKVKEGDAVSPATVLEIAEGVQELRFSYAVDTVNDDDVIDQITVSGVSKTYVLASSLELEPLATWEKVRAVRLEVLVRSDTKNVTNQLQQIPAPFNTVAADNNLYQIFSATLAMRNLIK